MTDRIPLDHLTSDALDALYDRAEQAEQARAEAEQRNADNWSRAEAAEARAERAEAALERVRVAVNALCHEPHPSHDHVCPDHIAAVVQAALNAEQVDPAEPAPAPVEPATPLPAPSPIPTPDAPDVDRSHNGAGPDGETPLVPAHDASLKQAAATETTLDQR